MTESPADLVRRMSRLLREELEPRGIAFALVVGIPRENENATDIGITSNISVNDAATIMAKAILGLADQPKGIQLVDAGDRQEGHA